MINAFRNGVAVQFRTKTEGIRAVGVLPSSFGQSHTPNTKYVISDHLKTYDWRVPGYLGEGFYQIKRVSDGREFIAHEDDLTLA